MMEGEVNLRCIKELLENRSNKPAKIYTHVGQTSFTKIENPLDRRMEEKGMILLQRGYTRNIADAIANTKHICNAYIKGVYEIGEWG